MTALKVKIVQDPTSAYEIDQSSKFEISMQMEPLNNPYLANMGYLRRPTNYLVKDARMLGMSNVIANSHGQAAFENIVFNLRSLTKLLTLARKISGFSKTHWNFNQCLKFTWAKPFLSEGITTTDIGFLITLPDYVL